MDNNLLIAALESAYPQMEGWRQLKAEPVDGIEVDQVLYQPGGKTILVLQMDDAIATQSDLKLAQHIKNVYEAQSVRKATVLLVYNGLLMQPVKVPADIRIMNVTVDGHTRNKTSIN